MGSRPLSSSAVISGTPSAAGTSSFTVQVADSAGAIATQTLTVTIAQPAGVILSGSIPPAGGFGLIVFSGGTLQQLISASQCVTPTLAFWVTVSGSFVEYVPNAAVAAVNAAFLAMFPNGNVPPDTALIG